MAKLFAASLMLLIPFWVVSSASASTAQDVSELVNAWIGHTEEELLEVWGEGVPMTTASDRMLHMYIARGKGETGGRLSQSVNSFPIRRNRTDNIQGDEIERTIRERGGCDITFEIQRGVIAKVSWSTEGSPDRDEALRTCWREFRRNKAQ